MKRLALILLLTSFLPLAQAADKAADELFSLAAKTVAAGKVDDAIPLYEKIITEHPEAVNRWSEAQSGIAQALAKKGDFEGALKAAHICLDGALTLPAFDSAVSLTAGLLSALDKNTDRANQFIAFQQEGPAAGKTNVMSSVGYPAMTERERAFAIMRQQAGDDAAASRFRAVTYLYEGKPKEALAQFAEAFRRNANLGDPQNQGMDLITVGLRAVRGYRVGLDQDMPYVIYGPNGIDGKAGTPDDLKDPFAGLLSPPPQAGEGGLSGMKPEDLAVLRQIRDAAQLYAGDSLLSGEIRNPALVALQRANSALDGWGMPGQKDWYLQLLLGAEGPRLDRPSIVNLATGGEYAARGREPHYGGVQAFWIELDADYAARKIPPVPELQPVRDRFQKMCAALGKFQSPPFKLKPLKDPTKF